MKNALAGMSLSALGLVNKLSNHKFGVEERNAARTTIKRSELHGATFTVYLWFRAPSYPPNIKKVKGIYSSGLDGHSLSDNVRFGMRWAALSILVCPSSLAPTMAGHFTFIVGQIGGGSFGLKQCYAILIS